MRGQRSITLETAERLCRTLHLELARSPDEPPAKGKGNK
jgi:hypothetical protein